MWIRSQDKLKLVDVQTLEIMQGKISDDSYAPDQAVWNISGLGEYSSKENCLVVLEDIERFLKSSCTVKHDGSITIAVYKQVFQMPQDNEV